MPVPRGLLGKSASASNLASLQIGFQLFFVRKLERWNYLPAQRIWIGDFRKQLKLGTMHKLLKCNNDQGLSSVPIIKLIAIMGKALYNTCDIDWTNQELCSWSWEPIEVSEARYDWCVVIRSPPGPVILHSCASTRDGGSGNAYLYILHIILFNKGVLLNFLTTMRRAEWYIFHFRFLREISSSMYSIYVHAWVDQKCLPIYFHTSNQI